MLRSSVYRTVDFCTRHAWWVILMSLLLAAASTVYATQHFAIKTDVTDLFPRDLPWTQRAFAYMQSFPKPESRLSSTRRHRSWSKRRPYSSHSGSGYGMM